jgi:hypothetical protein
MNIYNILTVRWLKNKSRPLFFFVISDSFAKRVGGSSYTLRFRLGVESGSLGLPSLASESGALRPCAG